MHYFWFSTSLTQSLSLTLLTRERCRVRVPALAGKVHMKLVLSPLNEGASVPVVPLLAIQPTKDRVDL